MDKRTYAVSVCPFVRFRMQGRRDFRMTGKVTREKPFRSGKIRSGGDTVTGRKSHLTIVPELG